MNWFWGKPQNPGSVRFEVATLLSKDVVGVRMGRKQFSKMQITGLYGISIGMRFFGLMKFGNPGLEMTPPEPSGGDHG